VSGGADEKQTESARGNLNKTRGAAHSCVLLLSFPPSFNAHWVALRFDSGRQVILAA